MVFELKETFQRFGRLDTWVVGIQYYDGAGSLQSPEVFFDRDPDNLIDDNAVAVFTAQGIQIGHLPRYDAVYFSPLIAAGVIALKGQVAPTDREDLMPLALEVYATAKLSEILVPDDGDDWRAIYHNLFIALWERLDSYSAASLKAFRDRFRHLAHEQPLYPKTQFLYRMLKAQIADLKDQEQVALREQVLADIAALRLGTPAGWPVLTVIPLDADEVPPAPPPADPDESALTVPERALKNILHLLPGRCPYPAGAHGAAVVVRGRLYSLDWFASAAWAQVYWYQMIVGGLEEALDNDSRRRPPSARTAAEIKHALLEAVGQSECVQPATVTQDGGLRVEISTADLEGHALYRDGALECLRLRVRGATHTTRFQPE